MSWDTERTKSLASTPYFPVHPFTWILWSTLAEDETHLDFLLQQDSYFSFFSSSLNYSLSTHSAHFLPSLEFEKYRIVESSDPSITTLNGGTYRYFLCSTGTQNSGPSSWPITHPSVMPCSIWVYPSVDFWSEICYVPDSQTKIEGIVSKRRIAFSRGNLGAMSLSPRECSEQVRGYTCDIG